MIKIMHLQIPMITLKTRKQSSTLLLKQMAQDKLLIQINKNLTVGLEVSNTVVLAVVLVVISVVISEVVLEVMEINIKLQLLQHTHLIGVVNLIQRVMEVSIINQISQITMLLPIIILISNHKQDLTTSLTKCNSQEIICKDSLVVLKLIGQIMIKNLKIYKWNSIILTSNNQLKLLIM